MHVGRDDGDEAQLLSQLQHLQQLTRLTLRFMVKQNQPAAAFSALTVSSQLQHLDITNCKLPAAAWQHIFPTARQLPLLRSLDISNGRTPMGGWAAAPEGSRLVSCCPGLQCLGIRGLEYSTEMLLALQGLSGLHILSLNVQVFDDVDAVCQLTGLRELTINVTVNSTVDACEGVLLQLTQLKQLTTLNYAGPLNAQFERVCLMNAVSSLQIWIEGFGLREAHREFGGGLLRVTQCAYLVAVMAMRGLVNWTCRKHCPGDVDSRGFNAWG
mgnify:CR=1 FL=1